MGIMICVHINDGEKFEIIKKTHFDYLILKKDTNVFVI